MDAGRGTLVARFARLAGVAAVAATVLALVLAAVISRLPSRPPSGRAEVEAFRALLPASVRVVFDEVAPCGNGDDAICDHTFLAERRAASPSDARNQVLSALERAGWKIFLPEGRREEGTIVEHPTRGRIVLQSIDEYARFASEVGEGSTEMEFAAEFRRRARGDAVVVTYVAVHA